MPKNNDELELELELERKKQEALKRQKEREELERERVIDGEEVYNPDEDKAPVEEEEYNASLDDDVPDEYYEDLFEEDWAEIEAAEAANQEKQDRLNRIKAKRKEREKKLKAEREAEARRAAARLAEQQRQQSQNDPNDGSSVSAPVTPVQPAPSQSNTPVADIPPVVPVEPVHTSAPIVEEEVKSPITQPVSQPVIETPVSNTSTVSHDDDEKRIPSAHNGQIESPQPTPVPVVKITEVEENVSVPYTTGPTTTPISHTDDTVAPVATPAPVSASQRAEEYTASPTVPPITQSEPVASTPSHVEPIHEAPVVDNNPKPHINVEETEYSRTHKKEMQETDQPQTTPQGANVPVGPAPTQHSAPATEWPSVADPVSSASVGSTPTAPVGQTPVSPIIPDSAHNVEPVVQTPINQTHTPADQIPVSSVAPGQDNHVRQPHVSPVSENVEPVANNQVNQNGPVVPPIVPENNSDFHNQMVDGVNNSEYSRDHKAAQAVQTTDGQVVNQQQVPISTVGSGKDIAHQEQSAGVQPIVGLKEDGQQSQQKTVVSEDGTQRVVGTQTDKNAAFVDTKSTPANILDIPADEKPFYTEHGIPLSVATAASVAAGVEAPLAASVVLATEPVSSTKAGAVQGSKITDEFANKTGAVQHGPAISENVEKVGTAPDAKAGIDTQGKDSVIPQSKDAINAATKSGQAVLTMPDYIRAADKVIAGYDKEIVALDAQLTTSREKLKQLKENNGTAKEIKAVRQEIRTVSDRLITLTDDRARVTEFIKNGPRVKGRITREDVVNSEYSRSHMADLKGGRADPNAIGAEIGQGSDKKLFYSSSNLKKIQSNRIKQVMGVYGERFAKGMKGGFKRVLREDEDLDKELEVVDTVVDARQIVSAHIATLYVGRELKALGLGHDAIRASLNEMGVIVGVGDVSKMSLNELRSILENEALSFETQKKVMEAIDLKKRLGMNNFQLADLAMKEAGEYINYSTKRLQQLLKSPDLDIVKKTQIQAALRYKKLNKWNKFAGKRWKITANVFGGLTQKLLRENEHLGSAVGMSQNAMTAYRAGRVLVRATSSGAKSTAAAGKKLVKTAQQKIVGLKTKADLFTKNQMLNANGMRSANLIGKGGHAIQNAGIKGGSKFAQSKLGQAASRAWSGIKNGFAAAGKAASGLVKGIGALIGGGSAAGAVLLILLIVMLLAFVVCGVYVMIFGDESNGTSVPEMVERLENKNTAWLEQIDDKATAAPSKKDLAANRLDEYTVVNYTYLDFNGNVCLVTDNTKEIISMAAVYFGQDFSDERAIFSYIDELWDKSHKLTTSESAPYGCNGSICLNEDLTFNTEAQGFNGGTRTFYCTENYNNIHYNDCSQIDSENAWRINVDKHSARFTPSVATANKYRGIYGILTQNTAMGYGCKEKTGTFYCTDIDSITNSEVLVKMVDSTGISYSTLCANDGCRVKHSGTYEGAPRSGCRSYDESLVYHYMKFTTLPKTDEIFNFEWNAEKGRYECYVESTGKIYSFEGSGQGTDGKYLNIDTIPVWYSSSKDRHVYAISYFNCTEGACSGHNITYHYCPGDHKEMVCYGHVDLDVNIEVYGYDGNILFSVMIDEPGEGNFLWDMDSIKWATDLRDQDWEEMYGVYVPSSLFENQDGIVSAIMPTHPNALPIPLFNQLDYPNSPYGIYGTVASHGCGITCVAMVDSYYKGTNVSPAYLARMYGHYNTEGGSYWSLFADTAEDLMIPFDKQTSSWAEVVQALQDGKPVVSIQNENGIFTSGGHFILLTGITPDGKILVNDPNGANYTKNQTMVNGFANGFSQGQIQVGSSGAYWIYGVKPGTTPTETP